MATHTEVPLERYALIAEVVDRFHGANFRLGKTALQKIVFLLQRSFGVDVDYGYTLYTYGPFCSDVARDLDVVEAYGGAKVLHDPSYGGYEIHPGPSNQEIRERSSSFLQNAGEALEKVVTDFGGLSAKELELRSTLIYLSRPGLSRDELIQQVHDVKPHFSVGAIDLALAQLEEKGYVPASRVREAGN